ncbi:hypothetical protein [Priestia abyssalis]|uniref:hypothetical protein n=1 Tax=Priestia abyssalis TaxID=1221450 RepID=UPI0009948FE0|nr:hypothetical protein [Priestia abyssalis]
MKNRDKKKKKLLKRFKNQGKSIQEGLNTCDGELMQSTRELQRQLKQLDIQTQEKGKQRKGLFKWFS